MGRVSNAKERLMEAVLELIWTGSYGNTTIDHICEKAGVKKGSFYYFFDSKADLAATACRDQLAGEAGGIGFHFLRRRAAAGTRLQKYCDFSYHFQSEMKSKYGRVLGCPLFALGSEVCTQDDRLRRKIQEMLADKCKYLESAIRDAHASGVIHAPDAEAKAQDDSGLLPGPAHPGPHPERREGSARHRARHFQHARCQRKTSRRSMNRFCRIL
jgi:TetR/AcrR family transcriptional regulator, transcriptional repressor for nem operon